MGAPKQKWTAEEETALRAGVARYGIGKWSAILKDPEFLGLLRLRSNVDLKDKWRNIHVMESGLGSRQRGRPAHKGIQLLPRPNHKSAAIVNTVVEKCPEVIDNNQLTVYTEPSPITSSKKPISRLEDVALKVVTKLKEPHGSTRASIASYIEERYTLPSDFEKLLAKKLKRLVENGKLTKVNHHYRLSLRPISWINPPTTTSRPEGIRNDSPTTNGTKIFTKALIENDLDKMRGMSAEEAAAAAAKAVAEAEAAIAEAEAAAREADSAEAEAEAAFCFAEAARKALNCSNNYPRLVKSSL